MAKPKHIRVSDSQHARLKQLAERHGKPISECAADALNLGTRIIDALAKEHRFFIQEPDGVRRPLELWILLNDYKQDQEEGADRLSACE